MLDPSASTHAPARETKALPGNGEPSGAAKTTRQTNGAGKSSASRGLERDLSRVDGKRWLRRLGVLAVIAAIVAGFLVFRAKTRPKPPPRYVMGQITKGDVLETVQSTGQVQPLTQVQVGAQVSGRITKVYVDFNSQVKKGDILAEIDPTLFGAQLDSTQAQLAAARASVSRAEANVETARQRLERAKKLVAEGIGTQADLDTAQGAYTVAIADVAAAKATSAQIQGQLRSSKTNLEYTRIYSPIDGVVINRAIDPGQVVAASFQAPILFEIAQDLRQMRVLADIDEADVGRLREAMGADVAVDAFPGEKFKGKVSQIRYSPNNQAGVVTYAAVIEVENPELKLRPGMTVTVTIRTAEVKDTPRIPNAALRFKPSPPVDKKTGKPLPQDPLPALPPHKGRIYVLVDETPGAEKAEMREIDIGITDGINTVLKGDLGDAKLIIDENDDPNARKGPKIF